MYLDVREFKVNFKAVYQLTELLRTVDQLNTLLNDTVLLAGSEATRQRCRSIVLSSRPPR